MRLGNREPRPIVMSSWIRRVGDDDGDDDDDDDDDDGDGDVDLCW